MESYRWKLTSADYGAWYQPPGQAAAADSASSEGRSSMSRISVVEAFPAQSDPEPFSSVYGREHEGKDTESNVEQVKSGISVNAQAEVTELPFDSVYGTAHEGKDTQSGLEAMQSGLVPESNRAAGEAFDAVYGNEYVGKDTESGLEAVPGGMIPKDDRDIGETFTEVYGSEFEGKDTESGLTQVGGGIAPEAYRSRPGMNFQSAAMKKS